MATLGTFNDPACHIDDLKEPKLELASGEDTVVAKVDLEAQHPVDEQDPNVVWWDGTNDPQNPMNWSTALKWGNIAALSGITFIT